MHFLNESCGCVCVCCSCTWIVSDSPGMWLYNKYVQRWASYIYMYMYNNSTQYIMFNIIMLIINIFIIIHHLDSSGYWWTGSVVWLKYIIRCLRYFDSFKLLMNFLNLYTTLPLSTMKRCLVSKLTYMYVALFTRARA